MELKPIKSLVVYRDLWVRGGEKGTALLNSNGMCCLGFACLATGVPANVLHGYGEPVQLLSTDAEVFEVPNMTEWTEDGFNQSKMVLDAMDVNDRSSTTDETRECQLVEIFALGGITLTFEDTAPLELRDAYTAGLPFEKE